MDTKSTSVKPVSQATTVKAAQEALDLGVDLAGLSVGDGERAMLASMPLAARTVFVATLRKAQEAEAEAATLRAKAQNSQGHASFTPYTKVNPDKPWNVLVFHAPAGAGYPVTLSREAWLRLKPLVTSEGFWKTVDAAKPTPPEERARKAAVAKAKRAEWKAAHAK